MVTFDLQFLLGSVQLTLGNRNEMWILCSVWCSILFSIWRSVQSSGLYEAEDCFTKKSFQNNFFVMFLLTTSCKQVHCRYLHKILRTNKFHSNEIVVQVWTRDYLCHSSELCVKILRSYNYQFLRKIILIYEVVGLNLVLIIKLKLSLYEQQWK